MNYRVNKEKCIGCGACVAACEKGTELGEDGKAKIIDSEKVEECGGESLCPYGAIEKVSEEK
jgi:ferredoxin